MEEKGRLLKGIYTTEKDARGIFNEEQGLIEWEMGFIGFIRRLRVLMEF